jgi:hypothetical protein
MSERIVWTNVNGDAPENRPDGRCWLGRADRLQDHPVWC